MKEAYKYLRSTVPSTEDPNVQHTYADKLKMFRQEISTGTYLIVFRVNKFLDWQFPSTHKPNKPEKVEINSKPKVLSSNDS